MNLILLDPENQTSDGAYVLTDRQQAHVTNVIKADDGERLRIGVLNSSMGEGIYQASKDGKNGLIHSLVLQHEPPKALPLVLVMALPRPNMLKRSLQNIATMGVKTLYLIHSAKVEKSYWQSPVVQHDAIRQSLLEGLEQAKDTIMPEYHLVPRFRPFVEDQLPEILNGKRGLLAHPYHAEPCPVALEEPCLLALGPEGGWNDFEVEKWLEAGMEAVHLGDRILRVETVVPVLLSRLYPAGL